MSRSQDLQTLIPPYLQLPVIHFTFFYRLRIMILRLSSFILICREMDYSSGFLKRPQKFEKISHLFGVTE